MTAFERRVCAFVRDHDGCTSIQVARALRPADPALKTFGYQRPTSRAIAALRAARYLEDVSSRCPQCRRALTRHLKNVPLHLTPLGRVMLEALT